MPVQYDQLPLGKQTAYADQYDASLLVPVPRSQTRDFWPEGNAMPFMGEDLWTAYEVSWLDQRGKPHIACLLVTYSEKSRNIVESKSLKLYLNSFNQTTLSNIEELINTISTDIAKIVGCEVNVQLADNQNHHQTLAISEWSDRCIDDLEISIEKYNVDASLLELSGTDRQQEFLISHLLRSNCPVTGQPDWASVRIFYEGNRICEAGLLRYICSFRLHQGFHEQCIERMFCDIWQQCKPDKLSIEGRFTRRGGLDINPFRASHSDMSPSYCRQIRQ